MDQYGFFGQPTTCEVCWEPSLPLKHAEILCTRHALEAGYTDPKDCPHDHDPVGIHHCTDCNAEVEVDEPDYDGPTYDEDER